MIIIMTMIIMIVLMIWVWFSPWKVSSTCPFPGWRQVDLRAGETVIALVITSSDEQPLLKNKNWATCGIQAPTSSPAEETNVAQAWDFLALRRSGREPRYLPWESYLGQKVDYGSGWDQKLVHLSTFPWMGSLSPLPPIMTSSCWNLTAQVRYPPFWRLNTVPPVVSIIPVFYRFSKRCVSCLYHVGNLLGTISPVVPPL